VSILDGWGTLPSPSLVPRRFDVLSGGVTRAWESRCGARHLSLFMDIHLKNYHNFCLLGDSVPSLSVITEYFMKYTTTATSYKYVSTDSLNQAFRLMHGITSRDNYKIVEMKRSYRCCVFYEVIRATKSYRETNILPKIHNLSLAQKPSEIKSAEDNHLITFLFSKIFNFVANNQ
jgi:hypothetical protein